MNNRERPRTVRRRETRELDKTQKKATPEQPLISQEIKVSRISTPDKRAMGLAAVATLFAAAETDLANTSDISEPTPVKITATPEPVTPMSEHTSSDDTRNANLQSKSEAAPAPEPTAFPERTPFPKSEAELKAEQDRELVEGLRRMNH